MTLSREEWLRIRKTGLGASDAAPICGLSPWRSALEVYLEKKDQLPPQLETPAMRWGLKLEEAIATAYEEETGRELSQGELCRHAHYNWMLCTPDRLAADRVVELKTVNAFAAHDWGEPGTDQVPEYYLLQVQHQMAVCEAELADVAVLVGGSDFRIYTVRRNDELIEKLIGIESSFWGRILQSQPPEPSWAHPSTPALIQAIHGLNEEETIEASGEALALVEEYEEARTVAGGWEKRKQIAKAKLLHLMGTAGLAVLPDGRKLRRKQIAREAYTVEASTYIDFRILNSPKPKASRS